MKNYLKSYLLDGEKLYLVSENGNTASQWSVYYLKDNELIKVRWSDFLDKEQVDEFLCLDSDKLSKALKKSDKMPAYSSFYTKDWSLPFFFFRCNAIWTSRPLEIVLAIGYALGLKFSEIKQNFQVL